MKSSYYSIRHSVATVVALCIVTDFSFGSVSCQDGVDYKNSCNPYRVKLIGFNEKNDKSTKDTNLDSKTSEVVINQAKSYFDTLLSRYSDNYNGKYGLQSIIDRDGYDSFKDNAKKSSSTKLDSKKSKEIAKKSKKESEKTIKRVSTTDDNKDIKQVDKSEIKPDIAEYKNSLPKVKKYKFYTVKKGDSISLIAKRYGVDIDSLKRLNSLDKNSTVKIGKKLKIPFDVTSEELVNGDSKDKINIQKSDLAKVKQYKFYTVKKGDSLSLIAKRYGVDIDSLKRLNSLDKNSTVKIGKRLKIPFDVTFKELANGDSKDKINIQKSDLAKVNKYKFYTVKKGDSLSLIAKRYGVDIKSLKILNSLDKNNTVKIGKRLKIPLDVVFEDSQKVAISDSRLRVGSKNSNSLVSKDFYTVKKGDSLSLIAKKSGVSITKLREINRLSRSSHIKVGDKIYLRSLRLSKLENRVYDFNKNIKFKKSPRLNYKKKIRVVATAYTSHVNQTDDSPFLAAWNNRLRPGMKIIAVSPDLIKKYGLTNGVKVKISGLPGYYTVRDKMNARLRNHIDIYMGVNKRRALRWGRRRIVLYW